MGLFKTFTYNVFDYKPRYYDPKIDEFHEKVMDRREAEGKIDVPEGEYVPGASIRGSFRSKMRRTSYGGTKKSTLCRTLVSCSHVGYNKIIVGFGCQPDCCW